MIDFRPGRRQIVSVLLASETYGKLSADTRGKRGNESEESYSKMLQEAWELHIKVLFRIADLVIKIDTETEESSPIDRPKY